jgi:hypothetical protein
VTPNTLRATAAVPQWLCHNLYKAMGGGWTIQAENQVQQFAVKETAKKE